MSGLVLIDIIFLAGPVAKECVDARNGAGGCRWLKIGKRLEAKPGIATAWVGAPSRRRKVGWTPRRRCSCKLLGRPALELVKWNRCSIKVERMSI